jgi:DNA-binding NarL/FixJ family response regulator
MMAVTEETAVPLHSPPRLVLCEDDAVMQRWCLRLAADAGVEVVGATSRWAEALELVVDHEADAVLIDIATVGRLGIRLIRAVRRLAPGCEILVLSPFRGVDLAAIEAGAGAIADPSDPRPVAAALKRLAGAGSMS